MHLVLVLALSTVVSHAAHAQAARDSAVVRVAGAAFALSVADLDASERWYVDKLGLRVVNRIPKANGVAVRILSGGGLTVELIQRDGSQSLESVAPSTREAADNVRGITKVGIVVDDFDRTIAALRARGVSFFMGPWPKRGDQPANVLLKDNSGNLIQIVGK